MTAKTIDEVIAHLDLIIDRARSDNSPRGYFAALYRMVTIRIKEGIERGEFDDNERMEKLDVIFANRYLTAYEEWMNRRKPTTAWGVAFEATEKWEPITLQHLLLGINAHINLDLGIATVKTTGKSKLPAIKDDFNKINAILGSLVGQVKKELSQVWPPLALLDHLPFVDPMIGFSIDVARDGAWAFAEELANAPKEDWEDHIRNRDHVVALFGYGLYNPGPLLRAALLPIRLVEPKPVKIIRILSGLENKLLGRPGLRIISADAPLPQPA